MGDWIKNNQYTAGALTSVLLILIFLFAVIKPYVDSRDSEIANGVILKMQESIDLQKQSIDLQKKLLLKEEIK